MLKALRSFFEGWGHQSIMSSHSFSLDPRTVLGVGPDATIDEIQDAYHSKSKKHHPDLGGDEWAFRMVARAYDLLKTTSSLNGVVVPPRHSSEQSAPPRESDSVQNPGRTLDEFRVVHVDLVWMRFELGGARSFTAGSDEDAETLSVCLVMSWPPTHLVSRTTELNAAADCLRQIVDLFNAVQNSSQVLRGRSRIEDGRFVGWLSYPNVLAAQDAFLSIRDSLKDKGLSVKLQTFDEHIPVAWCHEAREPVPSSPG